MYPIKPIISESIIELDACPTFNIDKIYKISEIKPLGQAPNRNYQWLPSYIKSKEVGYKSIQEIYMIDNFQMV